MEELKPCPFCGEKVSFYISDDEGNIRDPEYENDPWSGIAFSIRHTYEENNTCPIASYDGEFIGVHLYDTREGAAEAWNRRACDD